MPQPRSISEETIKKAKELRAMGYTYRAIDVSLGLPNGKGWNLCNRERYNINARDSSRRYRERGYRALCDMEGK